MNAKVKTRPFDSAVYLEGAAAIAIYMSEAPYSNDPAFIADAFGVVARARGMSQIARETPLNCLALRRTTLPQQSPASAPRCLAPTAGRASIRSVFPVVFHPSSVRIKPAATRTIGRYVATEPHAVPSHPWPVR